MKQIYRKSRKSLTWDFEKSGEIRKPVIKEAIKGYTQKEVNETIKILLSLTPVELEQIFISPMANVLEKIVAKTLYDSAAEGKLRSLELLLTRVFGKPRETVEVIDNPSNILKLTSEQKADVMQAALAYKELMK